MNKPTPGPWAVHHGMRDCVVFVGRHGVENLFLKNVDGYYACQSEADAHLISAAHELRDALIGVLRVADRATDEFDAARAALAKAAGLLL